MSAQCQHYMLRYECPKCDSAKRKLEREMSRFRMTPQDYLRRQQMNAPKRAAAAKRMNNASGTDKLRLVLPWPPTVNHSSGPTSNGGRYLTPEHKAFRNECNLRVIAAGSPAFGEARLAVEIHLTPPDKRRFDLDNRLKGTLDALQLCGVYEDDSQIDDLRVVRGDVIIPGEGSAVVVIQRRAA